VTADIPGDQQEPVRTHETRAALQPIVDLLRREGYTACLTLGSDNEWLVACDTEQGHVDVRIGSDEHPRAAREGQARTALPAIARGLLEPGVEAWWGEEVHRVGVTVRLGIPFSA
jgi:hypothetical protein